MRRSTRRGATLIECTLYLFIAVLLTTICCAALSTGYRFFVDHAQRIRRLAGLHTAFDLLGRDIRSAPSDASRWQLLSEADLSWQQDGKSVGWLYEKKKVWRVTRSFDKAQDRWRKRAKTMVINEVDTCRFILHKHQMYDKVKAVEAIIAAGTEKISLVMCVRSGVLS